MIGAERINEVYDPDGEPRPHYRPLLDVLTRMGPDGFAERRAKARETLRSLGATFPLPGDAEGDGDRIPPADWMPRILPKEQWETLSAGLLQRGRAINAWLTALYSDGQEVVPDEVVESSVFHRRGGLPDSSLPHPVHVYGPDVVRLQDGGYVVLEDNVRVPSGVAYAEAIRKANLAAFGETFEPYGDRIRAISGYHAMLRETLEKAAPGVDEPGVAIVTGGPSDSAFFEHKRIAEACGIRLCVLGDLRVEGGKVFAEDGVRVDVIYRRVEGGYVVADLPELEAAYRSGGVGLANALGVGVADDKAVFPYVEEMIRRYLGEEPLIRGAETFSMADPEARKEALERLPELVVKPREGYGGIGVVIGPEATREELDETRRAVLDDPMGFVAQECLDFSTHVMDDGDGAEPSRSYVDLRAFVLPAVGYVMPGGLTRVARPGTRVVNSSSGGGLKDTWVLED